jgi:ribosome maturation factor RimP
MSKRVVDLVEEMVRPFLDKENLECVDVAFVKEGPHRYLRVTIDKEGGISLEDTEKVSRFLSNALDENDPIKEQYFLEVTSPGIERPLKNEKDYRRFKGERVTVHLYAPIEGLKVFTGTLIDVTPEKITLDREELGTVSISFSKIAKAHLSHDFD